VKYLLAAFCIVVLYFVALDWRPSKEAWITAARNQIANFQVALGAYRVDTGHFPSTAEGLQALRTNPDDPKWKGPYWPSQGIPRDPWGMPYVYTYPGEHGPEPDILSYGADRQPGGEGIYADIVSWRTR
jgi:general secretion pathway protein G